MSGSQTTFARRSLGLLSRIAPDRRRHKRIVVELLGRFMRENKQEHACKLIDISAGGAAIKPMAPVAISVGERWLPSSIMSAASKARSSGNWRVASP